MTDQLDDKEGIISTRKTSKTEINHSDESMSNKGSCDPL